uniref:Uncharacterized protein LOC101500598 n=1 Tax=Rhizophora mucronata TaxID=61149 RepID=A0A2P2NYA1_RHIMU
MIERLNGDRAKFGSSSSSSCVDNRPICWPKCNLITGDQDGNRVDRRNRVDDDGGDSTSRERRQQQQYFCLHNYMDFFIHFTSKFPFVIVFLLVLFLAIPVSAVVLVLYLLVTVMFAVPSFLVLYFACPTLARLVREIIS